MSRNTGLAGEQKHHARPDALPASQTSDPDLSDTATERDAYLWILGHHIDDRRAEGVRQHAAGRLEIGRCLHNGLQAAHVRNSVGVSGA